MCKQIVILCRFFYLNDITYCGISSESRFLLDWGIYCYVFSLFILCFHPSTCAAKCKQWCMSLDKGKLPADICETLEMERKRGLFTDDELRIPHTKDWCELTLDSSDDESANPEDVLGQKSDAISDMMVELNKVTSKGKGKGKTTSKQMLNSENKNVDNVQLSSDEPSSLFNPDLSITSNTSQLKTDTGTCKHGTITPVLDTAVSASAEVFLPEKVSGMDHANLGTDQSKCQLPSSDTKFHRINQLDLLLSAAGSADAASSLIGSLNSEDQLHCLDALSDADINDVLEVIEKESST